MEFKSLLELLEYFYEEKTCIEFLEQQRWDGEPVCPFCGAKHPYRTSRGFKCSNNKCHKKFTVTVGTVFENTKISLKTWFAAIYLCTAHKKGISSLQLHRDLGITQKTAWFLLHRIREIMKSDAPELLTGTIQADETFVGGKNKNRHKDKKVENSQGRSVKDKTPVFGFHNNGKVSTIVVEDTKATTLKPIIKSLVECGSTVVTDEWTGYSNLSNDNYQHIVINHTQDEFVCDGFHTNGIEGFWGLFKRGVYGIYHFVSSKHLSKYCNEFTYRYNTREVSDIFRFQYFLTKISGRLTYKMLIGK